MSEVVSLFGDSPILVRDDSNISFPVEGVLEGAQEANLDSVIVIGDLGEDLYLSSSLGNLPKIIYLLELAKSKLLTGAYDGEED